LPPPAGGRSRAKYRRQMQHAPRRSGMQIPGDREAIWEPCWPSRPHKQRARGPAFEHRKAHTHASSQPKPAERRLVSDNGIMRRYTLVVTTLNPWITHAEFESCPSDAISPYTANGASRPLHGPPNCLFCAYIRHRVLTGGSESLHFGTECLRRWRCEKRSMG